MDAGIKRYEMQITQEWNRPWRIGNTSPLFIFASPDHKSLGYQRLCEYIDDKGKRINRLFIESIEPGQVSQVQTVHLQTPKEVLGWDDMQAHRQIKKACLLVRSFKEEGGAHERLNKLFLQRGVTALQEEHTEAAAKEGYRQFVTTFFSQRQQALIQCVRESAKPGDLFMVGSLHVDDQLLQALKEKRVWTIILTPS